MSEVGEIPVQRFIPILIFVLSLVPPMAQAASFKVYPKAKLEKEEMERAAEANVRLSPELQKAMGKSRLYSTPDSFENVYAFYLQRYRETDPALKKSRYTFPSGQVVSEAYFCLDKANSIFVSKRFIKIQHPMTAIYRIGKNEKIEDYKIPDLTLIQYTER
jgi:hypothetical protein